MRDPEGARPHGEAISYVLQLENNRLVMPVVVNIQRGEMLGSIPFDDRISSNTLPVVDCAFERSAGVAAVNVFAVSRRALIGRTRTAKDGSVFDGSVFGDASTFVWLLSGFGGAAGVSGGSACAVGVADVADGASASGTGRTTAVPGIGTDDVGLTIGLAWAILLLPIRASCSPRPRMGRRGRGCFRLRGRVVACFSQQRRSVQRLPSVEPRPARQLRAPGVRPRLCVGSTDAGRSSRSAVRPGPYGCKAHSARGG